MKQGVDKIHQFLSQLGLSQEEIKIYLALIQRGSLTTLEISRVTNISRTQIYRLLEKMKEGGLAEELIDEHRLMAKAVEVDQLERIIKEKERHLTDLRQLFPQVKQVLTAQVGKAQPETKVLFYRGKSGIRQMLWNILRAEKEVVGYTYRPIDKFVGEPFIQDWRDTFIKKQLTFRDVYSDYYLSGLKEKKFKGILPKSANQSRCISSKKLDIRLQVDIYNDVVSNYNWHGSEVFGVEIYNSTIAQFQKQMFELIWQQAKTVSL